jgi:dipeptidyl aminopeptidase/acylaminoacyl peptidase
MARLIAMIGATLAVAAGAADKPSPPPARVDFPGCRGIVGYLPTWSPDGRRLAYTLNDTAALTTKIVVTTRNGGSRREITTGSYAADPDWSPDGAAIAFTSDRGVELVDPAGRNRRFVAGGSSPSWSPDGTQLALIGYDGSRDTPSLDIIHADGTGRRRVLQPRGNIYLSGPDWSPNGGWIAYARTFPGPTFYGGVYAVRVDGSGERIASDTISTQPDWTPSSRALVYASWDPPDGRPAEIHRFDMATNRVDRVTTEPEYEPGKRFPGGTANDEQPAESPDGTRIVFVRAAGADQSQGRLWMMNSDGRGEHPLNPRCRFGTVRSERIRGTNRSDRIYGLEGADIIAAGAGNDLVVGGVGRDRISCGAGRDRVYGRTGDRVARDCETVIRR